MNEALMKAKKNSLRRQYTKHERSVYGYLQQRDKKLYDLLNNLWIIRESIDFGNTTLIVSIEQNQTLARLFDELGIQIILNKETWRSTRLPKAILLELVWWIVYNSNWKLLLRYCDYVEQPDSVLLEAWLDSPLDIRLKVIEERPYILSKSSITPTFDDLRFHFHDSEKDCKILEQYLQLRPDLIFSPPRWPTTPSVFHYIVKRFLLDKSSKFNSIFIKYLITQQKLRFNAITAVLQNYGVHENGLKYKIIEFIPSVSAAADSKGNTILHLFVYNLKAYCRAGISPEEISSLLGLIIIGCPMSVWKHKNREGKTPFHMAAQECQISRGLLCYFKHYQENCEHITSANLGEDLYFFT